MSNGNSNELNKKLDDALSFPILTEEVAYPALPRPGGSGAAPLGQIVERALREVLGWRPKAHDTKGFVAALSQAFALKEIEGHTEWRWTPRSYAVRADIGAITGAQASIYQRAKVALDQSLPLLDGLYSLLPDSDPEDTKAIRSIIHFELNELVGELGVEGDPRVQRVDELFASLLGDAPDLTDPEQVGGQLRLLRERLGLERSRVNKIEEEQNLTNFLILVDYINCLKSSWDAQIRFFDRSGTDAFLGTQLVLVSRLLALAVVSESVQEAYIAMNSVFLGQAEREATPLRIPGERPITVGELLAWVERFTSEEAPRLIQDGGKDGVTAMIPTLEKLRDLVQGALEISQEPTGNPTRGFHTGRVQRALEGVVGHLDETLALACPVNRVALPTVESVDPPDLSDLAEVEVTIHGTNFQEGAAATLSLQGEDDIEADPVDVVSDEEIEATFDLSAAAAGAWAIVVANPDTPDGCGGELADAVMVPPAQPLTITNVTFTPTTLGPGGILILIVAITVRNDSAEALPTQGPDPGFVYIEGQTFSDASVGHAERRGAYRVGVDFQGRPQAIAYPYRWGFGSPLGPGETRVIFGSIALNTTRVADYWAGLVHELEEWLQENEGTQRITVIAPQQGLAPQRARR